MYRTHTGVMQGCFFKDLSKLGRDLQKVIIVDNDAENFQFQPENGIYIKAWFNDPEDRALLHLQNILVKVAASPLEDVRLTLH